MIQWKQNYVKSKHVKLSHLLDQKQNERVQCEIWIINFVTITKRIKNKSYDHLQDNNSIRQTVFQECQCKHLYNNIKIDDFNALRKTELCNICRLATRQPIAFKIRKILHFISQTTTNVHARITNTKFLVICLSTKWWNNNNKYFQNE